MLNYQRVNVRSSYPQQLTRLEKMSVRPFSSATIISAGLASRQGEKSRGTARREDRHWCWDHGGKTWENYDIVTGYRRLRLFNYDFMTFYNTRIFDNDKGCIFLMFEACSTEHAQHRAAALQ